MASQVVEVGGAGRSEFRSTAPWPALDRVRRFPRQFGRRRERGSFCSSFVLNGRWDCGHHLYCLGWWLYWHGLRDAAWGFPLYRGSSQYTAPAGGLDRLAANITVPLIARKRRCIVTSNDGGAARHQYASIASAGAPTPWSFSLIRKPAFHEPRTLTGGTHLTGTPTRLGTSLILHDTRYHQHNSSSLPTIRPDRCSMLFGH